MKKFLSLGLLALTGLMTQEVLCSEQPPQKGFFERLREKLEETQRSLEEARKSGTSQTGQPSKESGSFLEQLLGMGKKEEAKPGETAKQPSPSFLERLMGMMGQQQPTKPGEQKATPSFLEQLLGLGMAQKAQQPQQQPAKQNAQGLRREEYESAAEKARRETPSLLQRVGEYLGYKPGKSY